MGILDDILNVFLAALEGGGQALAVYSLAILALAATISYYREYGASLLQGAGMGDALAGLLLFAVGVGGYYWLMVNLFPLAQGALATAILWGSAGVLTGGVIMPSVVFEAGLKVAYPIAEFDTWFNAMKSAVKLAAHPGDLLAYWLILLAFMALATHHAMLLIEYHMAIMCGAVLIPWGLWRATAGLTEFSLGWITGGLIRAFVSTTLIGIATPTFELLVQPAETLLTLPQTFRLVGGSLFFLIVGWVIPAQAARLAGHASLGLTGSTLTAAAMTTARFASLAHGATQGAVRGASLLLRRA